MTTVSAVIDETFNHWLFPSGVNRPAYDVLLSDISASATSISLEARLDSIPNNAILEIGSELVLTESYVSPTVTANERGYLDSTAATHTAGDRVLVNPMFSRLRVLKALQEVIVDLFPRGLYYRTVDSTKTYTINGVVASPTGTKRVLKITCRTPSSYEEYRTLRPERDEYDVLYDFDPPKIKFRRGGYEDYTLYITIAKDFVLPTAEADDLTTTCLVPSTLVNHLPMGVAGKILQSRELPRVQIEEVKRFLAAQGIQVGAAMNVGQALLNSFWFEVGLERNRLKELDPDGFEQTR